jgi:hypothetical protein
VICTVTLHFKDSHSSFVYCKIGTVSEFELVFKTGDVRKDQVAINPRIRIDNTELIPWHISFLYPANI